jgi:hypothetical protein
MAYNNNIPVVVGCQHQRAPNRRRMLGAAGFDFAAKREASSGAGGQPACRRTAEFPLAPCYSCGQSASYDGFSSAGAFSFLGPVLGSLPMKISDKFLVSAKRSRNAAGFDVSVSLG